MSTFFSLGGSKKQQQQQLEEVVEEVVEEEEKQKGEISPKRHSMPKLLRGKSKTRVTTEESPKRASMPKLRSNNMNNVIATINLQQQEENNIGGGSLISSPQRKGDKRTSTVHQVSRNVFSASGQAMRNAVLAPVVAGKAAVQGGVSAGQFVVRQGYQSTTAVVHAGAAVGNTVVGGGKAIVEGTSKAVVGGGMAIVGGTSSVVEYGGKTVFKGAKGVTKGVMKGFRNASMGVRGSVIEKKSKWEEGVEAIDALLEPGSNTYEAMTCAQRKALADVKKLLITGPDGGDKTQYIPRDLIRMKNRDSGAPGSRRNARKMSSTFSTNFLLQEYAGVKDTSTLVEDMSASELDLSDSCYEEDDEDDSATNGTPPPKKESLALSQLERKSVDFDSGSFCSSFGEFGRSLAILQKDSGEDIINFVPTEFKLLPRDDQLELYNMLSWDSLKIWGFDIFALNQLTRYRPLLFMGWAVLGSPYAQSAMAKEIGLDVVEPKGYPFMDELMIPPHKLCNYLRVIESDYWVANPYHNAIHAADVLQSLNTIIQMSMEEDFMRTCPSIRLFTILLSAVVHDVDHPGKTNAFHTQLRTELAVVYNDKSVLENWHVAHAFARMLDLDLLGSKSFHDTDAIKTRASVASKNCDTNLLCNATPDQFKTIRNLMIEAVLHTDMTKHFEMVNSAQGLLMQSPSDDTTWKVLMFMLHMADISGQAKPDPLFKLWTERCMDEFFAQGDEEAKLGLPISPNCDRNSVVTPDSQVGFIKFVVEPAYEVLAAFVPFVENHVLPIVSGNLEYWMEQMEAGKLSAENESPPAEATTLEKNDAIRNGNGALPVDC